MRGIHSIQYILQGTRYHRDLAHLFLAFAGLSSLFVLPILDVLLLLHEAAPEVEVPDDPVIELCIMVLSLPEAAVAILINATTSSVKLMLWHSCRHCPNEQA